MPAPETDLIKRWARIDGSEFDGLLPMMIETATALAGHETGVDYAAQEMPKPVQQWCAAQVSYWVNNPDAGAEKKVEVSPFLSGLLDPFRTYGAVVV